MTDNVSGGDGVKLTAEEKRTLYDGMRTDFGLHPAVERIVAARLAEVTREQDTAKENVRRLRFQVEIRDDEIDALNGQRDEALAVVEAARALADEWRRIGEKGLPHGGCLDMYRHCAGELAALLPAAPTSTREGHR